MEHTAYQLLAPVQQRCEAQAYDRSRGNRRLAFVLQQSLERLSDGTWQARREWRAVGPDVVAAETVLWRQGLVESATEQAAIGETARAAVQGGDCRCVLRGPRTGGAERERVLRLPHAAVTLGSLPLFIAQHWSALLGGAAVPASYLVLKVQRAATVQLRRASAAQTGELAIDATPANPLLRWIFGSTRCVFAADSPRLLRIEGLLDPRDVRTNGRWIEYLGSIEFAEPLDLSGLVHAGSAR